MKSNWRSAHHALLVTAVLTVVGLMLGIALSIAANQVGVMIGKEGVNRAELWIQVIAMFLYVTGGFYYYFNFLSLYSTSPTFMYLARPFLVGSILICVAHVIGEIRVFIGLSALFFAAGAYSFWDTIIRIKAGKFALLLDCGCYSSRAMRALEVEMLKNASIFTANTLLSLVVWNWFDAIQLDAWGVSLSAPMIFFIANALLYSVMLLLTEIKFIPEIDEIIQCLEEPSVE